MSVESREGEKAMAKEGIGQEHSLMLRHMPSLDALRGIAVLMVVLFHGLAAYGWTHALGTFWGSLVQQTVGIGRFGVNVFFVLSGFLITGILLRTREDPEYYRSFYWHRVLRILPAYLLTLLLLRLLHVIDWRFTLAALLFIPNFSQLFKAPLAEYGSLWTLGVEEQFYLFWPFCLRHLQERTLLRLLLPVVLGEPMLRLAAAYLSPHIDIHYKTPFVLDYLAYGALLALLVRFRRLHTGNAARIGSILLAASAVLVLLDVWSFAFHDGAAVQALGDLPFSWGACGAILLGLSRDHKRAVKTGDEQARGLFAFYGYLSYGLYLYNVEVYALAKHFLLRHYGESRLDEPAFFFPAIGVCIAAATAIAWVSRRFYEEPFLRFKRRSSAAGTPAGVAR